MPLVGMPSNLDTLGWQRNHLCGGVERAEGDPKISIRTSPGGVRQILPTGFSRWLPKSRTQTRVVFLVEETIDGKVWLDTSKFHRDSKTGGKETRPLLRSTVVKGFRNSAPLGVLSATNISKFDT